MAKRQTIEDVKNYLLQNDINKDCELLSIEYINSTTPLKLKCNLCGNIFYRDFNHIKRNRFRCSTCGITAGAHHKKYSKEDVAKKIWNDREYKLIGEYVDASTPVLCQCKHEHTFYLTYSAYLTGHSGCKQCANEALKGENHPNWQNGGHQETIDWLRHTIKKWKSDCLKNANYRCDISGNNSNDLVIHHLIPFSDLVQQASKNTNILILNKINEYSLEERQLLEQELIKLHTLDVGVVIERKYHNLFHQIYGKKIIQGNSIMNLKKKILKGEI